MDPLKHTEPHGPAQVNTSAISDDLRALLAAPLTSPPNEMVETSALLAPDVERGVPDVRRYGAVSPASLSVENATKMTRSQIVKRVKYYVPSTDWIPKYSPQLLAGDVLAGVTVASILVPQSISYATSLARLSPVAGLFSASIPGAIYALLGTCRQLNVAPEAALSLLVGTAVSDVLHSMPHRKPGDDAKVGLAVATIITVQAGFFTFILGVFRLGFIDVVLSRALLRGFITAVAVVIMIEQLIPMLGLATLYRSLHPHSTLEKIDFLMEYTWSHGHGTTAVISFSALVILVLMRWIKGKFSRYPYIYRLPEVLIVVVVSTILSKEFRWDKDGIEILGDVPVNTAPSFIQFPFHKATLRYLRRTTSTAILVSVVGFLDSIVSAKQNSARFGYSISPNRELVALGAGNLAGAFIPGTLPAYGSITRSRINADLGARTQMASFCCSAIVLFVTFFLLPSMYYLPKCVLAPVICLVVFSLLAEVPHDVAFYCKMEAWMDLALMFLTFLFSIIWDVEVGIVVSVIISLLMVVHRSSKTRMTILGRVPGTNNWTPINEDPEAEEDIPGALIVRIRENLDFANTAQLKERLRKLELYGLEPRHPSDAPRRPQASLLVFHMADVETCDATAVQIFYELLETYKDRGVTLFVTHLREGPRLLFEIGGIMRLLGEDAFHDNVSAAVNAYGAGTPAS